MAANPPVGWRPLPVCSDALAQPNTYINGMADTPIKKSPAQKLAEATEGYAAYRAKETAAYTNMLRLRAERLAREAANPPEIKPAAKPKLRKRIIRK
ncbi:hypothetical protein JQ628_29280 [Bradyrhizobium lablabi]|uniref:hypothetical protein n=1 Tax=Bradyrhizobium lablabi TaxID=722472 RepID=UPI001BA6D1D2|nr:hypothetical protein [Bradyrhizobium lablabi]MBR1125648.1 hypothetical protein [Bradyrhizobium lablabi]